MNYSRMTFYVVGFLFSEDKEFVALIRKTKPEWMKGLLNGIGGHMEGFETPHETMVREFQEETGVKIAEWKQYTVLLNENYKVYTFKAFSDRINDIKTTTEEEVKIYNVSEILGRRYATMTNLSWLIPMALDDRLTDGINNVI